MLQTCMLRVTKAKIIVVPQCIQSHAIMGTGVKTSTLSSRSSMLHVCKMVAEPECYQIFFSSCSKESKLDRSQ